MARSTRGDPSRPERDPPPELPETNPRSNPVGVEGRLPRIDRKKVRAAVHALADPDDAEAQAYLAQLDAVLAETEPK
jgi:hypothetical protein